MLIIKILEPDAGTLRTLVSRRGTLSTAVAAPRLSGRTQPVRRTGELAKLPFPAHPHMLRHGCGFKLANDGVDTRALQHFLGHRNIMHTVRYTELRSDRFDGFWKD
jgi:site-specific recombinase XerD